MMITRWHHNYLALSSWSTLAADSCAARCVAILGLNAVLLLLLLLLLLHTIGASQCHCTKSGILPATRGVAGGGAPNRLLQHQRGGRREYVVC